MFSIVHPNATAAFSGQNMKQANFFMAFIAKHARGLDRLESGFLSQVCRSRPSARQRGVIKKVRQRGGAWTV
jgi:hypothetical protein